MTIHSLGIADNHEYRGTMKRAIGYLIAITAMLTTVITPANAETDPFPGVALGAEIGSRQPVSSSTGNPLDGSPIITCPTGAGLSAVAGGGGNYVVCTKTWRPSAEVEADRAFQEAQRIAIAAAEAESKAWNEANPGKQKCVQWGPIVHANGVSTASGGVCANPVAAPSGSSDSATVSSSPAPVSETTTPLSSPVPETSTPVLAQSSPAPSSAPITSGLGGYAVVHPDGHVCGVIVATSSDPFSNGGTMPQEYMGCPAGARIVFQTTPSADGNVAGWHGDNVRLEGNTFTISNGSSQTTVSNGVATDPNGRTWDTGTGRTITQSIVDTQTVTVDTRTVTVDSSTVLVDSSTALALPTVQTVASASPTPAAQDNLDELPEVAAEEEVSNTVDASVINNKTKVVVSTEWENTKLSVKAIKKGSKKSYTFRFSTNGNGDYTFKSSVNLKGYTLVLYKGAEELDRVSL